MNGSAKVQSVTVAVNEVEACQEATGLSKEQACKKVVEAKKAGVESEQIADFAKSGKSMGVAMKEKKPRKSYWINRGTMMKRDFQALPP